MKKFLFLIFGIAAASPGLALEVPKALSTDSRLREVVYSPNQVFQITVRKGVATHIVLDRNEKILKAAPGFGADCGKPEMTWCIVADAGDNSIHVKPKSAANEPNNLEITTDKRLYSFDFVIAKSKIRDSDSMFRVTFKYPEEEAKVDAKAKAAEDQKEAIAKGLASKPQPKNWNYAMQVLPGSDGIAPSMAYDDGRFTYLKFPNNREMPEIFAIAPDGSESLTNSHIEEGDTVVIHRVYKRLVLRLSKQIVGIWNDSYDADGVAPNDGVTVSGLKRVMRGQK
jgi:type IV secretion system protein VirB9